MDAIDLPTWIVRSAFSGTQTQSVLTEIVILYLYSLDSWWLFPPGVWSTDCVKGNIPCTAKSFKN